MLNTLLLVAILAAVLWTRPRNQEQSTTEINTFYGAPHHYPVYEPDECDECDDEEEDPADFWKHGGGDPSLN